MERGWSLTMAVDIASDNALPFDAWTSSHRFTTSCTACGQGTLRYRLIAFNVWPSMRTGRMSSCRGAAMKRWVYILTAMLVTGCVKSKGRRPLRQTRLAPCCLSIPDLKR